MAYVDTADNCDRKGPIAAVIAIHAGMGFVLVTGLGGVIVDTVEERITSFDVKDDPVPPPDVSDPPPKPEAVPEQTFTVPKPDIPLPSDTTYEVEPIDLPSLDDVPLTSVGIPDRVVAPALGFDPIPPRPRNNPASWVTTADYPTAPLRREQEGLARFRLEIAASGKIDSCTITRSSGSAQLDKATCRNVKRRAKFHPARDSSDKPIAGHYESSVSWVIPD